MQTDSMTENESKRQNPDSLLRCSDLCPACPLRGCNSLAACGCGLIRSCPACLANVIEKGFSEGIGYRAFPLALHTTGQQIPGSTVARKRQSAPLALDALE